MAEFNYRDLYDLFVKSEFDDPAAPAPKLESQLGKQLGGKGVTGEESAYGKVYDSLEHPDRVFKFTQGDRGTFDNEMNMLMEAALEEQTAVPFPHSAEFYPESKGSDIGMGVIEMEKRDLGPKLHSTIGGHERKAEFKKAQELAQLYQAGIAHQDNHVGNIRYNPQRGEVDIIDLGLAEPATAGNYTRRAENVRKGLRKSQDLDAARLYEGLLADANAKGHFTHQSEVGDAARAIVREGEDILGMTTGEYVESVIPEPKRPGIDAPQGQVVFRSDTPPPLPGTKTMDAMFAELDTTPPKAVLGSRDPFATALIQAPKAPKINPKLINRIKSGVQGGIGFGLSDLIPSAEVIRTGSEQGLPQAGQQFVQEAAEGLPMGLSAGVISALAPAAAPTIGVLGGGLLLSEGARSLNEATRALTGESALSKIRQTIGTKDRTGRATPGGSLEERFAQEQAQIVNPPTITPTKGKPRRAQIKDTPMPGLAHRLRLAGDRFNPMRGEFGLTELIFGR